MRLLPGLHGERLVKELLVEILLYVMNENNGFALVIILGATCSAHHLQNIFKMHRTYVPGK